MRPEIIEEVKSILNKAPNLKACTIQVKPDAWLLALCLKDINNTEFKIIRHNDDLFDLYSIFEEELDDNFPKTMQFLMHTNLKLEDIKIMTEALKTLSAHLSLPSSIELKEEYADVNWQYSYQKEI